MLPPAFFYADTSLGVNFTVLRVRSAPSSSQSSVWLPVLFDARVGSMFGFGFGSGSLFESSALSMALSAGEAYLGQWCEIQ